MKALNSCSDRSSVDWKLKLLLHSMLEAYFQKNQPMGTNEIGNEVIKGYL